jgi:CHASE2 domain-containing sensor protein
MVCFSAPEAKWWNSLWFFFVIFMTSVTLGVIERKSIGGIFSIILSGLGCWFSASYCMLDRSETGMFTSEN